MKLLSNRAGQLHYMSSNYDCFVPTPLNKIEINMDDEMVLLLSDASNWLGKLDGISSNLPDRDIFISMYVQKEAVVSSQIEATQASLTDVLQMNKTNDEKRIETEEIVNYVHALNYGINKLSELPISVRYLKEIHSLLLKGVRENTKSPGELRNSQNWIGPTGCNLTNATYIPPAVDIMQEALSDLEKYINSDSNIPNLIKIALIHYQFETIHPFLDGNGRLGRILISLWLKENKVLEYPLLYLSLYFKQNRTEYYGLLMDVRFKGYYEEWIKFFLKGVTAISQNSYKAIEQITIIMNKTKDLIESLSIKNKSKYYEVMKYIYSHPYFDSKDIQSKLEVSKPTTSKIIEELSRLKIISKTADKERYVTYRFDEYADILENGTDI